jgi:prepilin-type N-terminal cleavage/methylation domain-containing protein
MTSKSSSRRLVERGFTIIEVLIAVVVLATGVTVVLQGLHVSLSTLDAVVDKTRAAVLLDRKLGDIRRAAIASQDPSTLGTSGAFDAPYDSYRWEIDTAVMSLSGSNADAGTLHAVDASVWHEGRERRYFVSTLVYVYPQANPVDGKQP